MANHARARLLHRPEITAALHAPHAVAQRLAYISRMSSSMHLRSR
jgi:hypothetical protein